MSAMQDLPVDRPTLRYADVSEVLRRELAAGQFAVGGRFPGEAELQERFGVGRHTAREALKMLADEGYIDRRRKAGTVVLAASPAARYSQPLGSLNNLLDFGIDTRLRVHAFGPVRLRDERLCDWLKLPPDRRWLRIAGVRVRRDSPVPVCWSEFYVPPEYGFTREALDANEGPMYSFIGRLHGFEVEHVDQEIGAAEINSAVAGPLMAEVDSAGLVVVRRYYRSPVEDLSAMTQATLNLFPAGRYSVRSKIERDR